MKTIDLTQLEKLKGLKSKFDQLKVSIGDLEIQKQLQVAEILKVQAEFQNIEKELIAEYGHDAVLNLNTGEIKTKT
jgi:uncharacterized protein (DUF111 family)